MGSEEKCPIRVYRFTGPFVSGGGVPKELLEESLDTTSYMESVVSGRFVEPEEEEDKVIEDADDVNANNQLSLITGEAEPGWHRHCNDDPGCLPAKAWNERQSVAPLGMQDVWDDYAIVRWTFDPEQNIDDVRKEAFRSAAEYWRRTHAFHLLKLTNRCLRM